MKTVLSAAFAALVVANVLVLPAHAGTVPCEDMLKDLRTATAAATLDAATKQQVDDLTSKGIERCNADDDKRADGFFQQAMALIPK